ncbi:hypothetical protein DFJ73DRAFT_773630 [Zopfochytrium polystomum]|nr:hypothetical protein DFJ73DRAFT_773630 [Zopfochytrium polystomum]
MVTVSLLPGLLDWWAARREALLTCTVGEDRIRRLAFEALKGGGVDVLKWCREKQGWCPHVVPLVLQLAAQFNRMDARLWLEPGHDAGKRDNDDLCDDSRLHYRRESGFGFETAARLAAAPDACYHIVLGVRSLDKRRQVIVSCRSSDLLGHPMHRQFQVAGTSAFCPRRLVILFSQ